MKHTKHFLLTLPLFATLLGGCKINIGTVDGQCPVKDEDKYTVGDFDYTFSDPQKTNLMVIGYHGTDTNVTIPEQATVLEKTYPVKATGCSAFYQNKNITRVELPDTMSVIGEDTFRECSSLSEINLPSSLTVLGEEAFASCSALKSLTFSSISVIGSECFMDCDALTEVVFEGDVDVMGESCFEECSSLKSVSFKEGVDVMGESAFYSCEALENLTLGKGTDVIGEKAFAQCKALSDITYLDTSKEWKHVVKGDDWCKNVSASVVHCTDQDVSI